MRSAFQSPGPGAAIYAVKENVDGQVGETRFYLRDIYADISPAFEVGSFDSYESEAVFFISRIGEFYSSEGVDGGILIYGWGGDHKR